MPTPSPIIGTRISVTVLKCVSRASRKSSRKALSTAVIANRIGISAGTSARKTTIMMMNPASRPIRSLAPDEGGGLSPSPVNLTWIPAGVPIARRLPPRVTMLGGGAAQLVLEVDDLGARQLEAGLVVLGIEERDLGVLGHGVRALGDGVLD